jgi:SNF2 family DNA or RNA helicase
MTVTVTINNLLNNIIFERMKRFYELLKLSKFDFKQHQYDGVKWCIENELRYIPPGITQARGGFIADEMGLGKTILMIGTMFCNYVPRTLIIVPPVLIQQWYREIYKTTGHMALLFYGANKKNITKDILYNSPIVLTSYNMLISKKKPCLLKDIAWNRVIFDEGHHLCNGNSERFHSCANIKAPIRWIVTGTPIRNKQSDFYNLCKAIGMKSKFYKNPDNLPIIGKHFVLRRTKKQLGINLPPVETHSNLINWTFTSEMKLARDIHSLLPGISNVLQGERIGAALKGRGSLIAILRAKQSCVMTGLMREPMMRLYNSGLISYETIDALDYSSKLITVINTVFERKDNGNGKIIFCQFRSEIDFIAIRLSAYGMKKVVTYDGRNSGKHNLAKLSEPADVLIIQIQTGCEGLNLQENFSEIYFVAPHWCPFVEDQAIARCHRIGQTKPVTVFKFEMNGFVTMNNDGVVVKNEVVKNEVGKNEVVKTVNKKDETTIERHINNVQLKKRIISDVILNSSHS